RILFCLFAEDTGIFPQPRQLELYLKHHTAEDGSDLGLKLARLFDVLNTPEDKRQTNLDADLKEFPYVNGDLFKERLSFADFNSDMRNALIAASGGFRWEKISPAVFGSLFQDVMLPTERRQLGAHYTAEKNIMKVVCSLFLDDLSVELEAIKKDKSTRRTARLDEFHDKLARLTFFDPACGCGNFLVITYRELRALELDVLRLKFGTQTEMKLDEVNKLSRVDVDQMFGIEIEEFPARIAEVALWLTDHQANTELSIAFTQRFIRIPLRKSPHIHVGNALRMDWKQVLAPGKCSYVLGNPPFVGKHLMNGAQDEDMALVWKDLNGAGFLDYVTGWYVKAAQYITGTKIVVGFVSTNSICQGEQVGILWNGLFQKYGIKIHSAHRTFSWESEARGKAHVHVVIVGFAAFNIATKRIYDYGDDENDPVVSTTTNISPYLIDGPDVALPIRREPICDVPPIVNGNKPADGGFLIVEDEDRAAFLKNNPSVVPYLREMLSADQYLNGAKRWVLWLLDAPPNVVKDNPDVYERVKSVREFRLQSPKESTKRMADKPTIFDQIRQPTSRYLLIPRHSSENRRYVPFGYFTPDIIISDSCTAIPDATFYHFGVISAAMHMSWLRQVCGRIKSDFRYSNKLVYNNFPWPQTPGEAQKAAVEKAAQAVLDARAQFMSGGTDSTPSHSADNVGASAASITPPAVARRNSLRSPRPARDGDGVESVPTKHSTLADLYDPVAMPPALARAHTELDRAVDRCYRKEPFSSDRARVEFLFQLYEQLTAPLIAAANAKVKRPRPKSAYAKPPPAPISSELTPEKSYGDAAHFYSGKENSPPYRTSTDDTTKED
ncbi:MAG: DNA methyltransferase, partial [Verrucomicrobiota bacterium]